MEGPLALFGRTKMSLSEEQMAELFDEYVARIEPAMIKALATLDQWDAFMAEWAERQKRYQEGVLN